MFVYFFFVFLQRFYGEKEQHSKEIDLTLKLSTCGENVEEKRLIRSSSMVGEIGNVSVSNWCSFVPSLERSCSLPIDSGKIMLLKRQRSVADSELHGNFCLFSNIIYSLTHSNFYSFNF